MFNIIKDNLFLFILLVIAITAPGLFVVGFKVILYIILGVIILALILGAIFRSKIRDMQRQAEQQMGGGAGQGQGGFYSFNSQGRQRASRNDEEGEVKIFREKGSGEKKVANNVGDYVDFEEVDDK